MQVDGDDRCSISGITMLSPKKHIKIISFLCDIVTLVQTMKGGKKRNRYQHRNLIKNRNRHQNQITKEDALEESVPNDRQGENQEQTALISCYFSEDLWDMILP